LIFSSEIVILLLHSPEGKAMGVKCPKCNSDNTETAKFCSECGTNLYPGDKEGIFQTKTLRKPKKDQLLGKTIVGRYKIIDKLGEGGMGFVYKAKDNRLDRSVALKFLPPDLTSEEEAKKRFIQEAKAAAALNHPHICTIYEIDEADEHTFISMEYIKGQSLKDKLESSPLTIDEAKDIALQVAAGLEKAHKKGIVHRDIKPANIMINDEGQAKITDFGLAKLSWGVDLTKPSTIMGTVAYMSPEQAKGEEVDHRTDIWSLGAMLYEMLTGERPFEKDREQALIYAILNDNPTPLSLLRSNIPTYIEQMIEKALAKKASERYLDIQELIQDLKLSLSFPKAEKSIVVLPFDNMSPDPEQEYFCDGMTEEIISDLSKVQALKVISRSSAMTFKGTKKKINTIAQEVKVQYVLEGSVRKAGNSLRITAQLIEAANDIHLWAEKYSGTMDDVFDIQETVSRSIVEALQLKLSPEENRRMSERPIENVPAYELYLKAYAEILTFNEEAIERAIRYLKNALNIVGDNALLHSGLAFAYGNLVNIGAKQEEYLVKAEDHVKKALAIDPECPKAHVFLGAIYMVKGSILKSARQLKKALEITPDDSFALASLVQDYVLLGKMPDAESLCERVLQIDPLDFPPNVAQVLLPFYSGQYDKALKGSRRLYDMFPENSFSRWFYALILTYNNQYDKAFSIIDQSAEREPGSGITKLGLMLKYGLQGEKDKVFQEMTHDFQKTCQRDPGNSHHLAGVFALLDEKEEALNWLESAVNGGLINYPLLNEQDPFLENIRSEPRFKKLMERVKHEWENIEV
jgi:serine/threonine protein kinase/TPR repeat protein